jgi:hypothetical protein
LQSTISSEARLIKELEAADKQGIKHLRNQVIKELSSSPTAIRQITPTKLKVTKKRKNNSSDISPKTQKDEKSEKLPTVVTKKPKDRKTSAKSVQGKHIRKLATDTLIPEEKSVEAKQETEQKNKQKFGSKAGKPKIERGVIERKSLSARSDSTKRKSDNLSAFEAKR